MLFEILFKYTQIQGIQSLFQKLYYYILSQSSYANVTKNYSMTQIISFVAFFGILFTFQRDSTTKPQLKSGIFFKYAKVQGIQNLSSKIYYHSLSRSSCANVTKIYSMTEIVSFVALFGILFTFQRDSTTKPQLHILQICAGSRYIEPIFNKFITIALADRPVHI